MSWLCVRLGMFAESVLILCNVMCQKRICSFGCQLGEVLQERGHMCSWKRTKSLKRLTLKINTAIILEVFMSQSALCECIRYALTLKSVWNSRFVDLCCFGYSRLTQYPCRSFVYIYLAMGLFLLNPSL